MSTFEGTKDLESVAQVIPEMDVIPALNSELQEWAIKVARFIYDHPENSSVPDKLVFKPLSSDAYSMTFHRTVAIRDKGNLDEANEREKQSMVTSEPRPKRLRVRTRRREVETLKEQFERRMKGLD